MENEEEYFTYKETNNDLGKCMNDLRESHKFCDFIIRVGDEEIKAHKIVLAAKCDMFRAMFSGNFKESTKNEIELGYLNASTVKKVVEFIYTGTFTIPRKYELQELEKCIEGTILGDTYLL